MDINERNSMITKMSEQIKERQKYLQERFKELKKNKSDNSYLNEVKDDYQNYFNYINNIKQDQLTAFEKISTYLDKVGCELKTTDTLLEETKYDQKQVLSEISNLREELNKITSTE
tara:strand:- start:40 stop:387 length:348 start_codon:yes stop_codon:yes gene_type:complete